MRGRRATSVSGWPREGSRRAAVTILALLCSAAVASANPFLGPEEAGGLAAPPPVRAPASAGPFAGLQVALRERAAGALASISGEAGPAALAAFLGAAFLYGLAHAAGPGHRKTVVFSLFLGRASAAGEPAAAGFLSAGIHAGSGLAVVGVLSLARGALASLGEAESAGAWLDGITFGLLALAALALAAAKLASMARRARSATAGTGPRRRGRGLYATVALASLVPCPGATMLLLFAVYAGSPGLGAAGVLAMSLGMGLVVSAAGYLARSGREGLFLALKERGASLGLVSEGLELLSYLLVLAFSLYAAWPFIAGLLER